MEVGLGGAGPSMAMAKSSSSSSKEEDDELAELPPGFRFHPTDEEIIMHYLLHKVVDRRFSAKAIGEADLNKCEPWDLPKKAKMGEKEWFFFCQRDRKYPTGMRTNRATETGYWKATGKDKEIYRGRNCLVGMKKTLVFYKGRAPKGEKTNWVMHEFRLEGTFFSNYNFSRAAKEEFVVCRVFHKNSGIRRSPGIELSRPDSFVDRFLLEEIPPLMDYSNTLNEGGGGGEDYNVNPSSRAFWSNHNVHPQTYPMIASNAFSIPQNAPPSSFLPQYCYQDQAPPLLSHVLSYPEYQRPKMENFSSNNSVMSHSQDTGLSTENVANHEITSKKAELDDDQGLQALAFSPSISDLDSLWSY